jgi:TolA-binding protein
VIAALALLCVTVTDPLERAYDAAKHLSRQGRKKEAADRLEALAADHPTNPIASKALEAAGAIHEWDLDDPVGAARIFDRVLAGSDEWPGVLPALFQRLGIERDRGGPKAELELAKSIDRARPNASFTPWLLIHVAQILADDLDDLEGALVPLERLRRTFPKSVRLDEALMKEAEILRKLKRPKEALKRYRAIIDTQSTSLIVGDYNSTKLDDAYYQTGETYRLDLKDDDAAMNAYEALVKNMPLSRFVDDALMHAAQIANALGDVKRAAELRERLRKLRPESRYLGEHKRAR